MSFFHNSTSFEGGFNWKEKSFSFAGRRETPNCEAILLVGCLVVLVIGTTIIILEKCPNTRENINDRVHDYLSFGERLKRQSGLYPRRKCEKSEDRQAA